MKTAEEWWQTLWFKPPIDSKERELGLLRDIQLDNYRAGMEAAANLRELAFCNTAHDCKWAILKAAKTAQLP